MSKIISFVCLTLLMLQVSACATRTEVEQFDDMKGFKAGRKGIVIIQTAHKSKETERYTIKTIWENKKTKRIFTADPQNVGADLISSLALFIPPGSFNYQTMVYFIEPGEYDLTNIKYDNLYANSLHDILTFFVGGGEVVYLGKLIANHDNSRIVVNALDVEDSYSTAKEYLEINYPQVKQAPIKRLIKFSPKAKIFKSISKEYGVIER